MVVLGRLYTVFGTTKGLMLELMVVLAERPAAVLTTAEETGFPWAFKGTVLSDPAWAPPKAVRLRTSAMAVVWVRRVMIVAPSSGPDDPSSQSTFLVGA